MRRLFGYDAAIVDELLNSNKHHYDPMQKASRMIPQLKRVFLLSTILIAKEGCTELCISHHDLYSKPSKLIFTQNIGIQSHGHIEDIIPSSVTLRLLTKLFVQRAGAARIYNASYVHRFVLVDYC